MIVIYLKLAYISNLYY